MKEGALTLQNKFYSATGAGFGEASPIERVTEYLGNRRERLIAFLIFFCAALTRGTITYVTDAIILSACALIISIWAMTSKTPETW
jgi:hypothetical protein